MARIFVIDFLEVKGLPSAFLQEQVGKILADFRSVTNRKGKYFTAAFN